MVATDATQRFHSVVNSFRKLHAHEKDKDVKGSHNGNTIFRRPKARRNSMEEKFVIFLSEAQGIRNALTDYLFMLRQSRKQYLNDQTWTSETRAQWDNTSRAILQSCADRIATLQTQCEDNGNDAQKLLMAHKSAVVWYLGNQLGIATKEQTRMQMLKAESDAKKLKRAEITISDTSRRAVAEYNSIIEDNKDDDDTAGGLDTQQRMQLEYENEMMLEEFLGMNEELHVANKAITEILTLQSQLETHILTQYEQLTEIHSEALGNSDRIQRGNRYLDSARRNSRATTKCVLFVMIVLLFALIFMDYYN